MSETSDPLEWYRRMQRLRRFEAHAAALVETGEIVGAVHEYTGEEAVAVGVCAALRDDDVITSTHRGHGHILAKGGEPKRMFAELLGRETGYNAGRGGSMHIADFSLGIYGANGIVGAGAPMACGAAHAFRIREENRVAVPFFGDGAMNQGVLLESFNLAMLLSLPVVFVCENNGIAITSSAEEMTPGGIAPRAAAFGLPSCSVDGMDVRAVHESGHHGGAARPVGRRTQLHRVPHRALLGPQHRGRCAPPGVAQRGLSGSGEAPRPDRAPRGRAGPRAALVAGRAGGDRRGDRSGA